LKNELSNNRYIQCIDYLSEIFNSQKPLGMLFRADNCYLYDSGTNKLLKCDTFTYSLLGKLLFKEFDLGVRDFIEEFGKECFIETTETLKKSVENHNLFGLYEATNFNLFPNKEELIKLINTECNMLGLEVTDRCNLRCQYCVHSEENREIRAHGSKNIKIETAFAAIERLKKNSEKSRGANIIFYGGEPLLNFPLIKKCIKYAKDLFIDKYVFFSMTTNGTQITPEIAKFLFTNQVKVKVSLDGPEAIHDRYRKNFKGKGSYRKTLLGLRNLINAYGDLSSNKISLNMVYTPPFSQKQIEKRLKLWSDIEWLPNDILANISYYSGPRLSDVNHEEDKDLLQWAFEEYCLKISKNEPPHPFTVELIEKFFAVFSQRTIYNKASDKFALNGCCIPGVRRIFVTVDGNYKLCERIATSAPIIGNVKNGIDIDVLYDVYIKAYGKMSLSNCKKCWAINICDSCFIDGFDNKGMSAIKKAKRCYRNRVAIAKKIHYFCRILELIPNSIKYFQSINLK